MAQLVQVCCQTWGREFETWDPYDVGKANFCKLFSGLNTQAAACTYSLTHVRTYTLNKSKSLKIEKLLVSGSTTPRHSDLIDLG